MARSYLLKLLHLWSDTIIIFFQPSILVAYIKLFEIKNGEKGHNFTYEDARLYSATD